MPKPEDRVVIKLGPNRYDTPKAIRDKVQEVIDEQPPSGGGITEAEVENLIDQYQPVTGGAGQVIGLPVGTPFVYVPANLAANPADLAAIGFGDHTFDSQAPSSVTQEVGAFAEDTADVIGLGVGTVMNADSDSLFAYNPTAGTTSVLSFAALPGANLPRKPFTADNKIVVGTGHDSTVTNPVARVYDGSTWSSITLTNPATSYYWGMGQCTTTSRICAVYSNSTSTANSAVIRVAEYSTSGGANVATNTFTIPTAISPLTSTAKIENGWIIVIASADKFYVGPANATSTNTWREMQVTGAGLTLGANSITIGASGIGFGTYVISATLSIGLFKFDANTGVVTLFAGALDGTLTSLNVTITGTSRRIASCGIAYANDDAGVLGGFYNTGGAAFTDSMYVAFDTTGGSVSLSTTTFASTSTLNSIMGTRSYSPVVLASGDVTFVSNIASPASRLLYQVAGP